MMNSRERVTTPKGDDSARPERPRPREGAGRAADNTREKRLNNEKRRRQKKAVSAGPRLSLRAHLRAE